MGKIVKNAGFFKSRSAAEAAPSAPASEQKPAQEAVPQAASKAEAAPKQVPQAAPKAAAEPVPVLDVKSVRIAQNVLDTVYHAEEFLNKINQPKLAKEVKKACTDAAADRFTVAVVGEFSRGKSSFINAFLGKDVLPVGNLPTTAMLTRIRYHKSPVLLFQDNQTGKRTTLPLKEESWDGLTANNITGEDVSGSALVGINNPWLQQTHIELLDTPGAGDLEAHRAKLIGDALLGADGAIITINAAQALSMSEKSFIEQRLLSRQVPFLMLIVTKLDTISLRERSSVVDYIHARLDSWGMKIPVYLPYDVEMPDSRWDHIMGMDKIREVLLSWANDPTREALKTQWLVGKALTALSTARDVLEEQQSLMDTDAAKRQDKIRQKAEGLDAAKQAWAELQAQMLERCNQCHRDLTEQANDACASIIERLQYEVSMNNHPQKWWNDSYPYRLKIELANMASAMNKTATQAITNDARWFNSTLEQKFKAHVMVGSQTIYDKNMFGDLTPKQDIQLENLDKQRTVARIGTTALTLAGAILCSSIGAFVPIATMGLGTGSSILTESIFKGKIENQRQTIRNAIAANVPQLLKSAMEESHSRLRVVYEDTIDASREQQRLWLESQQAIIRQSAVPVDAEAEKTIKAQLDDLQALAAQLTKLIEA